MPKLIIIEGADCSGKSTLSRHAAVQLDAIHIHASGAKSLHASMMDYHRSLLEIVLTNLDMGRNVVMDRFWPSEYVYGQIFRPAMSDRVYDFAEILTALSSLSPVYVFCDDPEIEHRHLHQKDSDHPYDHDAFNAVVVKYRNFFREMEDTPAFPLLHHPATPPAVMKFDVRRYSVLDHGDKMGTFVDTL